MITDAILDILFSTINFLIGLLPLITLPAGVGLSVFAAANSVFPFDVMLSWLGVSLLLGSGLLVFWLAKTIFSAARGGG